ncbi:MAG TPA: thiamine diphosphokinase [bacterium]|nr:thiamine diphosphokinase [bacterium]
MRAAILANGRLTGGDELRRRLRKTDVVICADGGLRAARRVGVRPDVAIGDFDSASRAIVGWARSAGASIITHPVEKDKTDAELALAYAVKRGAREIEFFGALGGRLDHLLANVGLLISAAERGARLRIVDGKTEAFLAQGRTALDARRGDLVSLLSLSRRSSGITTKGLKYPLRNATLRAGSTLGISNEIVSLPASVTVGAGRLLLVVTRN